MDASGRPHVVVIGAGFGGLAGAIELQSRLAGGIWTQCSSWYRAPNGRISTNWPGSVREYHRRTAHFDPADYRAVA